MVLQLCSSTHAVFWCDPRRTSARARVRERGRERERRGALVFVFPKSLNETGLARVARGAVRGVVGANVQRQVPRFAIPLVFESG